MSVSHLYKDFAKRPVSTKSVLDDGLEIEEEKLKSFEDGYKSGWDDAMAAQEATRKTIGSAFSQNLQEASFSYHEARTSLSKQLRSLVESMLGAVMPELASQALHRHVLDQIHNLSSMSLDKSLELVVATPQEAALRSLCESELSQPFVIVPDDSLAEFEVYIRLGTVEREIDLSQWTEETKSIISNFFDSLKEGESGE